jgi:hypothetical protein
MKLEFECLPSSSFGISLYNILKRPIWEKLSEDIRGRFGYQCGICGSRKKLSCHEIWSYNDVDHIQTLVGLLPLCHICHDIKHWGRTTKYAIDMKIYEDYFMLVNDCTYEEFIQYKKSYTTLYSTRNEFEWTVNFGTYKYLLKFDNLNIRYQSRLFIESERTDEDKKRDEEMSGEPKTDEWGEYIYDSLGFPICTNYTIYPDTSFLLKPSQSELDNYYNKEVTKNTKRGVLR